MICKNCNTEFDTSKVRLGESIRCPGCGKVYQRKAITATSRTTKKATPRNTAKKAKRSKKKRWAG